MEQTRGEEPCLECPAVKLDEWLQTQRGRQLAFALELDRLKMTAGVVFRPGDLTYPEVLLLCVVCEEREKYQQEVIEESAKHGSDDASRRRRR